MRNDTAKLSAECLDDDCNVVMIDVDGDGIPDYVAVKLRWILAILGSLMTSIFYML
jgi:hypothetical protein